MAQETPVPKWWISCGLVTPRISRFWKKTFSEKAAQEREDDLIEHMLKCETAKRDRSWSYSNVQLHVMIEGEEIVFPVVGSGRWKSIFSNQKVGFYDDPLAKKFDRSDPKFKHYKAQLMAAYKEWHDLYELVEMYVSWTRTNPGTPNSEGFNKSKEKLKATVIQQRKNREKSAIEGNKKKFEESLYLLNNPDWRNAAEAESMGDIFDTDTTDVTYNINGMANAVPIADSEEYNGPLIRAHIVNGSRSRSRRSPGSPGSSSRSRRSPGSSSRSRRSPGSSSRSRRSPGSSSGGRKAMRTMRQR